MTLKQLTDAIFDPDGRSVNYFNGRLLSAEDLSTEQNFNNQERKQLGQAIGQGIVHGLEVRKMKINTESFKAPNITVTSGLAINPAGETLYVPNDIDLSLARPQVGGTSDGATFSQCGDLLDTDNYVAGAGLYLLTMFPVEGQQGRAYSSGLNNSIAACNTKYNVKGVRFRLIQLDLPPSDLNQPNLLRNRIAYRCFGTADANYSALYANLFGTSVTQYGLLDSLRPNVLTDCDVPLAVLYWTSTSGLVFLDMWSVRRRIVAPDAGTSWPILTGNRRSSEGEAICMQFSEQINDLRLNSSAPITIQARTYFRYLPAAGVVPLSRAPRQFGFSETNFFDGITTRGAVKNATLPPIVIESARLEKLLRDSFAYPPIDLSQNEVLWVYHIRENMAAEARGAQPYVVFASGHMPYIGDAHYNVNRWSLSNFAL